MRTWDNYKEYVKAVDPANSGDIAEAENIALIVGAIIDKRNELGITQRQLAEMCGIPLSSVARIEAYRTTPNLNTLLKLMQSLGLALSVVTVQ